jgi:hypothetical protein
MNARTMLLTAMAMMVAGCSVNRTSLPLVACHIDATPVLVRVPGLEEGEFSSPLAPDALSPYEQQLAQDLAASYELRNFSEPQVGGAAPELTQLILSGGGQWGSFGTGFMRGWVRRTGDRLPKFDSVTGVSTGALQSTFAFLGTGTPPAAGRQFPASEDFKPNWEHDPERVYDVDDLKAGYWIQNQDTLYRYRGASGIIRRATAGDLSPLERRMKRLISFETLQAVQREGRNHRSLRVAVVDWDSGRAMAVDMVKLANQLNPDRSNFEAIQQCYVGVLLAASSETLAMPPVRMGPDKDHDTLYYDAGIRFGVFASQGLNAAREALKTHPGVRSTLYVIANNELRVAPSTDKERQKWTALDLAGRGRQILVNQVYLMSIERIFAAAAQPSANATVRFAYVRPDNVATCLARPEVQAERETSGKDQHFYPLFMHCLMDVGFERGLHANWDH